MNLLVLGSPDVAALAWVNDCRAELGLPPLTCLPRGLRLKGESCPLANALRFKRLMGGVSVQPIPRRVTPTMTDSNGIWVAESGSFCEVHRWTLPDRVVEFVQGFDAGEFPAYDEELAVPVLDSRD